jgi:pyruvate dehydrogenase E2 component (dihydrolipoamide acetyltransferase)
MEQGTILSWLKTTGDQVRVGDELLEVETDKATFTHIAETAGILEIIFPEGATVAVGVPIARIDAGSASREPQPSAPHSPPAAAEPDPSGEVLMLVTAADGSGTRPENGNRRVNATPLARRTAAAHGVELEGLHGTGPLGRITRADVLKRAGVPTSQAQALPTVRPELPSTPRSADPAMTAPLPQPGDRRQEPTRLQQLIARRMTDARATIPHFEVQTEVEIDDADTLRTGLKAIAAEDGAAPSLTDIIIKAVALALREHPRVNGSYRDQVFVLHEHVNIGIAVAADDALLVPTIRNADTKSLGQIARESHELAAQVRSGQIAPAALDGGTFTVSNLGMFGMTAITPVINPPQAAILGVGAVRSTLARVGGEIVDRELLTLTLSCDHRILYGADAARFLAHVRELLQTPLRLVL